MAWETETWSRGAKKGVQLPTPFQNSRVEASKLGNVVRAVVRLHQPSISSPSLTVDACVVQITPFTASLSMVGE